MIPLRLGIAGLSCSPGAAIGAWLDGTNIIGRRGAEVRPAGPNNTVALTQAAVELLPPDDPAGVSILDACRRVLQEVSSDGAPWNTFEDGDRIGAIYTTGRVLHDVGIHADRLRLVSAELLDRAYGSLLTLLEDHEGLERPSYLPFLYRSAIALLRAKRLEDTQRDSVGRIAQGHIHRFVALHALGSPSQVDVTLLCLALALDSHCSNSPLSQRERVRCLSIAFDEYEPLPTVSRSTLIRMGKNVLGCSGFEALFALLRAPAIRGLLHAHEDHLVQCLQWLEDHSQIVGSVKLFQSDLWPEFGSYDAWFNALVLLLVEELRQFDLEAEQEQLRQQLLAAVAASPYRYDQIVCGGYDWPKRLRETFIKPVAQDRCTSPTTGNGIVLFGPPGTGKTSLGRLLAAELGGWYFVKLSSADFLAEGREGLFRVIRRIFEQLRRLQKCVVLFDELELLVLDRTASGADWTTGIITNVMLPELQELHDRPQVIPIFATNHISKFDAAGRRPGRFDYVLPVGLPSEDERRSLLDREVPKEKSFTGIASICHGGTRQEILEWARRYSGESASPDFNVAHRLWTEAIRRPRVSPDELKKFEQDVADYSYPSWVRVQVP